MAKKWLDGNAQVLATRVGGNLPPGVISVKIRYPGGLSTSWLTMRIEDYMARTSLRDETAQQVDRKLVVV